MKRYGLLIGLLLSSSIAFSAPNLITVTMQGPAELPAGMTAMIPSLYVQYGEKQSQLLLLHTALKPGGSVSQSIYIPANAVSFKPGIAFIDKVGAKHFSYCHDVVSVNELTSSSHPTRLQIKTTNPVLSNNQVANEPTLSCSYQVVPVKQSSEQGGS